VINILLVDDHDLVRLGINRLLSDIKGFNIVGEAKSGEEAIEQVNKLRPDVVLMDVKMPGMGGLEATKRIVKQHPKIKVLVVTVYGDEPYPSRVLQAGATGYMTKGASVEEMVQAIKSVYSGKRYLSPEVAQQLALKHLTHQDESPFESLSERELQVLVMITSGQKVQEIADQLYLSPKTVNSYRYRLFEKLNVDTDVELTHLAIRHKLIAMEVDE
jgi:two-component system, NarL family, invasion response regulator UvrY